MSESQPGEATFGEELKRHRLLREVSLESIASATKISVRHLQALERADFAKLPAPVFTRGFIRAYASFLGLDPEEMVNAYLSETTGVSPARFSSPGSAASRRPSTRAVVLGIVAAAVAVLIAAAIWRSARRPRPTEPLSPSLPPVALSPHIRQVAPATVPGLPATSAAPPAPDTRPAAEPANREPPIAPPLTLLLSTQEDCWSQISADGRPVFSGIVHSGETRHFEARNGFQMTVGNAGAVRLAVNGRSLPAVGKAGEVVRGLRLDADSVNAMLSRPE